MKRRYNSRIVFYIVLTGNENFIGFNDLLALKADISVLYLDVSLYKADDLNAVTELLATHDSFPGPNEYPTKTEFHDIVREALARALNGDDVDAILTDAAAQTAALREG